MITYWTVLQNKHRLFLSRTTGARPMRMLARVPALRHPSRDNRPTVSAKRHNCSSNQKLRDKRTHSNASAARTDWFHSIKFFAIDEHSERMFLMPLRAYSGELVTLFIR